MTDTHHAPWYRPYATGARTGKRYRSPLTQLERACVRFEYQAARRDALKRGAARISGYDLDTIARRWQLSRDRVSVIGRGTDVGGSSREVLYARQPDIALSVRCGSSGRAIVQPE